MPVIPVSISDTAATASARRISVFPAALEILDYLTMFSKIS